MKHLYLLSLYIAALFCFNNAAFGQLSGGNVFLQGVYLEIGQDNMGAFGTCSGTVPAGYHPHMGGATWNPGDALGEVYDWGHDGWSTGTPPFMGDYTEPGFPFEGWSFQVGPTEYRNWVNSGLCAGTGPFITGANTGYSNVGGNKKGMWAGGIAGISIMSETRVDTMASAVVVTVRFYNTTAAPVTDIYYSRTCDPDNVSTWGGSYSTTHNVIVHQNEDATHEVLVSSVGDYPLAGDYNLATYMSLGTKDCRAVCTFFGFDSSTYGLTPDYSPDSMWHKAKSLEDYSYGFRDSNYADIGFALVYNLGTLTAAGTPGDSAIISYAYIFNTNTGIDSAFPEPLLVVDGDTAYPSGPAVSPTFDTFNTCNYPGLALVPVTIINASDKVWSWSTWTWSPSIGLSSTTGVSTTINWTALPGIITYTITGTDSAMDMFSCHNRVMYLTVLPCLKATSNSGGPEGTPGARCLYDSLRLNAIGDSTDATYFWYGPGGYAAYTQSAVRPPWQSESDTGWYYVVKTVGGLHDTAKTYVLFNPLPVVTATSNSPVCSQSTLSLFANPDSASETFSWTGPGGFISGLQNPSRADIPVKDSGLYKVVTNLYGCVDSNYVDVVVDSTPQVPFVSNNSPGPPGPSNCPHDTLMLYASDSTPGVTYLWNGPGPFTSTDENPVILDAMPVASGVYTVTVSLGTPCNVSAVTSVSITPTPPLVATNNGPVCTGINDTLWLQALSLPGATYSWTGPYTFFSLNQYPFRTPMIAEYAGVYQVTAMLNGCPSATVNDTVVARVTPNPPGIPWLTFCQFAAAPALQAMGDSILWYPSPTSTVGTLTPPVPPTDVVGVTWYYVSQTLLTCTSAIDSIRVNVIPKPIVTVTPDLSLCPHDTAILRAVDTDPIAYYHWSPSLYLSDTSTASVITRPEAGVHYTVVVTNQFGCTDTAYTSVTVYAGALLFLGDSVTLFPGETYQMNPQTNCTSFEWFPPAGLDNAHISDPVASPELSTKYIVNAETSWGCKAVDSIDVTISSASSLAMPNAFTPGTGPNSQFKIIVRGMATLKYFRIWDRWGVKVFETTDINQGWDGTYSGAPQPFGVYVYEVSAIASDGSTFVKHGNITLIR